MSKFSTVLDYVPVAGSLKNGIEACVEIYYGNTLNGIVKGAKAIFGIGLDLFTFSFGATFIVKGSYTKTNKMWLQIYGIVFVNVIGRIVIYTPFSQHQLSVGSAGKPTPQEKKENLNPEEVRVLIYRQTMSFLSTVLDHVPVAGSLKNGIEACIERYYGNNLEASDKFAIAMLGFSLDLFSYRVGNNVIIENADECDTMREIYLQLFGILFFNIVFRKAANVFKIGSAGKPPPSDKK